MYCKINTIKKVKLSITNREGFMINQELKQYIKNHIMSLYYNLDEALKNANKIYRDIYYYLISKYGRMVIVNTI